MRVKARKNKVSTPMRVEFIDVYFADGIDHVMEVIDFAITYELLPKGGAWYTLPDESKVQGKEKVLAYFTEHDDEFKELREKIYKRMGLWEQKLSTTKFI